MNKEKVFGLIKKKEKERDKEVTKKFVIITLIVFSVIGVYSIMDDWTKIDFVESFLMNGLLQWLFFIITLIVIFFGIYVFSQLSTKKYKLKEIKK